MKEPKYINCSCGSEVLRVQYDEDIDSYDVAIYTLNVGNMSWKDKFRYIWQVLRHGEPYGDRMIVDRKEMNELSKYLTKVSIERMKKLDKKS